MLGCPQDPAALLRVMIEGTEPLDLPLAAQLSVRLARRREARERAWHLCDDLIEEMSRISEATRDGRPADPYRAGAAAALWQLETTLA